MLATGSVEPTNDEKFFRATRSCLHAATRSKGPAIPQHEIVCPELDVDSPAASVEWLGDLDGEGILDLLPSTPRGDTDDVRLF